MLPLLLLFANSYATNYYMATNGSDGNDGRSTGSPWATIGKAAGVLGPGDTLFVRGGTYTNTQEMNTGRSGTANSPIVVTAYRNEVPLFSGPGSSYSYRIKLSGNYWVFRGLHMINDPRNYRLFELFGDHITIENCDLRGLQANDTECMSCVWAYRCDHGVVRGCTLQYCGDKSVDSNGDIVTLLNGDHWVVENNVIRYGAHSAVLLKHDQNDMCEFNKIRNNFIDQVDTGTGWGLGINLIGGKYDQGKNCYNLIEGNHIRSGGNAGYKQCLEIIANGNTVRNNICDAPYKRGIILQTGIGDNLGQANRNLIYNNTFYGCGREGCFLMVTDNDDPDQNMADNIFANNIWVACGTEGDDLEIELDFFHTNQWWDNNWGGNVFKNNLIRHNGGSQDVIKVVNTNGSHDYYTVSEIQNALPAVFFSNIGNDPSFAYTGGNYPLSEGSPCIDAGVPIRDTLGDIGGWNDLVYVNLPDIGAYEYGLEPGAPPVVPRWADPTDKPIVVK
jgi:hypothetical protein